MRGRCTIKYYAKYTYLLWKFYERGKEYYFISVFFENTNVLVNINIDYIVYLYV